ncbi:MAG: flagellar biosynthetic protein FliO [Clostridiaceae bacterium]|nr:flagellar biosynthetic protein FliO [Clostridiaceae bacterium]
MKEIAIILLAFAFVLLLCYYTTKLLGKKLSGSIKNKSMKIIETLPMGLDRCLYLIRAGNKHFLFYSSKRELNLVSEIDLDDEAEETVNNQEPAFSFKSIFRDYSGLSKNSENDSGTSQKDIHSEPARGIVHSIRRLQKINEENK